MRSFFNSSIRIAQCTLRMYGTASEEAFGTKGKEIFSRRKSIRLSDVIKSDLLINRALGQNESVKDNQWGTVRSDLLKNFENINEVNVDSQVYDICCYYDRIDQAINYFKFLERNKYPTNLTTMTTYLRMLYLKNTPITEEEEKSIIRINKKIQKEHEILDPRSATNCILGLSLTKKWKECFKLIEMIKFIELPGFQVVSAVVSAAFRNNEANVAWKLIDEYHNNFSLKPIVYTEYLNYCKRTFSQDSLEKEIEKMVFIWQKYDFIPHESTINEYAEFFNSIGYVGKQTSITQKGVCNHCGNTLQQTALSKEEFSTLSSAILKNLIVGKDVYRNTSPDELKNYMIFLQTMKPYDVVIDGLNVAYSGVERGNRGSIENVLFVVNYFRKRGKRTLVVGRLHMKWWSSKKMGNLEDITDVFYTKNLSQDDPFLLHLTLRSGPDTCFVSRDLMRQHRHKLQDSTLKKLFKNWQMSRQYTYTPIPGTAKMRLTLPLQFDPTAQKNNEGWHIPYTHSTQTTLPVLYEAPENWMCLKHKKSKKS